MAVMAVTAVTGVVAFTAVAAFRTLLLTVPSAAPVSTAVGIARAWPAVVPFIEAALATQAIIVAVTALSDTVAISPSSVPSESGSLAIPWAFPSAIPSAAIPVGSVWLLVALVEEWGLA